MCLKTELFVVECVYINPKIRLTRYSCESKKEAVEYFWHQITTESVIRSAGKVQLMEIKAFSTKTGKAFLHIDFAQFYEGGKNNE